MKTARHVTAYCRRSQDSEKICEKKTFLSSHSRSSSRSDDQIEWKPDTQTGYFSQHSDARRVGCSDCSVLAIYDSFSGDFAHHRNTARLFWLCNPPFLRHALAGQGKTTPTIPTL